MRSILAALALVPLAQAPAWAEPVQPTTKWFSGFDGTQCLAMRDFGPTHLVIKAYGVGSGADISVIEDGASAAPISATGSVSTDLAAIEVPATRFGDAQAGRLVSTWMVGDLAALKDAQRLTLTLGDRTSELAMTQATPLVALLDRCRVELQDRYDFARAAQRTQPTGSADVFADLDYAATAADPSGSSRFRALLLLDETGKIADCSLVEHDGDAQVLAQACEIIRSEARFAPAIGSDGTPVRSAVLSDPIEWGQVSEDVANANRRRRSEENARQGYADADRGSDAEGALMRPPGDPNVVTYPQGRGD